VAAWASRQAKAGEVARPPEEGRWEGREEAGRKGGPGWLGHLGQMNKEKGFSILEIILDLTKDLENN
jgi:hypothetical protein